MDYLTPAQLDSHFTTDELQLLESQLGATPARRAEIAAQVSDEVAGYVGARELANVPPSMVYHAAAIARFRLYRDEVSDRIKADHDIAMKYFAAVQAGKVTLPLADNPDTPEDESAPAVASFVILKPLVLGTPW